MPRVVTGILAVLVVGFLVRMIALGDAVTASNDAATLAMLKPPAGFAAINGSQDCRAVDFCFGTSGLLTPMTQQNAATLISQFGLAVRIIHCQPGSHTGLTCVGQGMANGLNRTVNVFFSIASGPHVNEGGRSTSGTYTVFGTRALRWLPWALKLA